MIPIRSACMGGCIIDSSYGTSIDIYYFKKKVDSPRQLGYDTSTFSVYGWLHNDHFCKLRVKERCLRSIMTQGESKKRARKVINCSPKFPHISPIFFWCFFHEILLKILIKFTKNSYWKYLHEICQNHKFLPIINRNFSKYF